MKRHKWEAHKMGEPPKFTCKHCGRNFTRRQALEREHVCKK